MSIPEIAAGLEDLAGVATEANRSPAGYYHRMARAIEALGRGPRLSAAALGVEPGEAIDNSEALLYAIQQLPTFVDEFDGYRMGMGELILPAGVIRITQSGILSNIGSVLGARGGYKLRGQGTESTIIWLDGEDGQEKWFYDNGATRRMSFCTFEDIQFAGGIDFRSGNPSTDAGYSVENLRSNVNGFKFTGPGTEDSHIFSRCKFIWLNQCVQWEGTNNADSHRFVACSFWKSRHVFHINNPQSLGISDIGGRAFIYGDYLTYGSSAAGGGNFTKIGGDCLLLADEYETDAYAVRTVDGGPGASSAPIAFIGVRFELRLDNGKLAKATALTPAQIQFTSCSFHNTATTAKEIVEVGGHQAVMFDQCSFSNQGGGAAQFKITASTRYGHNPHLIFRASQLPSTIHDDITWNGGAGKLTIDPLCYSGAFGAPASPIVNVSLACNIYGTTKANSTTNRSGQRFTAAIPANNALTNTTEYAVRIPPYSEIVEVWAKVEANAGTGSNVQIHIGNDDKSVTYATSSVAAFSGGLVAFETGIFKNVGVDAEDRVVRIWLSNGAGGAAPALVAAPAMRAGVVYE